MSTFLVVALTVWGTMHTYVFWRLASLPWLTAWIPAYALALAAFGLWFSFPAIRWFGLRLPEPVQPPLTFATDTWVGILFLLFSTLLAVDVVTLGGWLGTTVTPTLRTGALAVAAIASVIALVQGLRAPVVTEHDVELAGLPRELDGLRLAAASDFHLGPNIGARWLRARIDQIEQLRPDLVAIVGDLVDNDPTPVEGLRAELQRLRAPLGVWAVTGNHEHYAGVERCNALFREVGFQVLHDRAVEAAPGLVMAGVDDLTARPRTKSAEDAIARALREKPGGATILLSHTPPRNLEVAAESGAGLVLSGHTHNGQIWPFNYLVRLHHPRVTGRHEVDGMTLIIGRGTGTWGPRMRLWQRGEILLIRLHSPG